MQPTLPLEYHRATIPSSQPWLLRNYLHLDAPPRLAPITPLLERIILPMHTREHRVPRSRSVPAVLERPRPLMARVARKRIVVDLLFTVLVEYKLFVDALGKVSNVDGRTWIGDARKSLTICS
jgi:hypothetical protein